MNRKRAKAILFFVVLLGVLALSGCGRVSMSSVESIDETKEPEKGSEVFEGGGLTLSIDYGFDKYVKSGRYMRVMADITNSGENFSGSLQVIIPSTNDNRYMYQKEVSLAAGETKRVEMAVPVGSTISHYNFVLVDEGEKVVAQKAVKGYALRYDALFAGILTDDTQGLAYLNGNTIKTTYLSAETFPEEALALDSLDIILINDFNTEKLNEKQYEALKSFVMRGGTLVLGTGSTGLKTMAGFSDSFLNGSMGGTEKVMTSFGLNEEGLMEIKNQLLKETLEKQAEKEAEEKRAEAEKAADGPAAEVIEIPEAINQLQLNLMEKDIMEIHLTGAVPIVEENGYVLLEELNRGRGTVLLSTMDLGLDASFWNTIGTTIVNRIAENISEDRKNQITAEQTGQNYSYLWHTASNLVDEEKIPTVGKYIAILVVYLIVTGPLLYFILKKLDKRNFTWLLVPVFSALFATFIYGIGGATRQDEPYIGYMSIKNIENQVENTETYFSITVPYNNQYEMDFSGMGTITPELYNNYYDRTAVDKDSTDYNIAVKYKGDSTKIEIRDYPAFEAAYFKTESSKLSEGRIDSGLKMKDFKVTGTVTNDLGYDLKQAALYAYGVIYPLGDIEQGKSVSLDGKKGYKLTNRNSLRNYDDLLEVLSGGAHYGQDYDAEKIRWNYTYDYYLTKTIGSANQSCYLLGFSESGELELPEGNDLDSSGATMLAVSVPMDLSHEGIVYIPRIDRYIQNVEGGYDSTERTIYEESIRMDVQFAEDDRIKELVYSETYNREFEQQNFWGGVSFYGEVKAYNYMTGEYDTIFTSGTEAVVPAENYIDFDNKMKLLIEADPVKMSQEGIVAMPVLSAVKEEK